MKMNSSFSSIGKIISPHCPLIGSRFPAVHGLDQSQRSDCDHETERQKLEAKREKFRRGGAHEGSGRIIWERHQPTAVWPVGSLTCCGGINTDVYASSDSVSRLWECWRNFELSIAVLWTRQVPQDLSTLSFNNEISFGHLFWLVQSLFAVAVVFSTISTAPATGEDTLKTLQLWIILLSQTIEFCWMALVLRFISLGQM